LEEVIHRILTFRPGLLSAEEALARFISGNEA
jgi:hypothetical protein